MNFTNQHLADFIDSIPGGNVTQYAKLLNITPIRINAFLMNTEDGQRLVKKGKVRASMKGRMPYWATKKTVRGVLTAENVPVNSKALNRILDTLPEGYREDAIHMFRMLIQMSSGNITFEDGFAELSAPYSQLAIDHDATLGHLNSVTDELATLTSFNTTLRESVALLREQHTLTTTLRLAAPASANEAAEG